MDRHGWGVTAGSRTGAGPGGCQTGSGCMDGEPPPPGPSFNLSKVASDGDLAHGLTPRSPCYIDERTFRRRSDLNVMFSLLQITRLFAGTVNVTRPVRLTRSEALWPALRGGLDHTWHEDHLRRPAPWAEVRLQDRLAPRPLAQRKH